MTQAQKFLFETCFDGPAAGDPQFGGGEGPEAPVFTETELEQARVEALAAGRDEGLRDAAASMEQATAGALDAIAGRLTELMEAAERDSRRRDSEALAATMAVLRKMFPALSGRHGLAEIEALVAECLERLSEEPRLVIRVADQMLDPLRERLDGLAERCGYEGKIVLLADEALKACDGRVEWADGGAEQDSGRLWRQIDEILARAAEPEQAEPRNVQTAD